MAIRIEAAKRLLAYLQAKLAPAPSQQSIDELVKKMFPNPQSIRLTADEKKELKLPYPYVGEVWFTRIWQISVYVSVNASIGQLWLCAWLCNHDEQELPEPNTPCCTFIHGVTLGHGNDKLAIVTAVKAIMPRILKWIVSLEGKAWNQVPGDNHERSFHVR